MLSQVELGRPKGEVFPGYREAALPSSHQEGGVLRRPGWGQATPGARWMGAKAGRFLLSLQRQRSSPCVCLHVWSTKANEEGKQP